MANNLSQTKDLTVQNLKLYIDSLSEEEVKEIDENWRKYWDILPGTVIDKDYIYSSYFEFDYDLNCGKKDGLTLEEYLFWWR